MGTPDSVPPYIKLTEYLKQFENKQVSPEILPFDAIIKFHNLSSFDGLADLDAIVKEYKDHCYSEKDSYHCYLYVWEKEYLGLITKKLKKSATNFSNFVVDENSKLSEEENKLIGNESDVVLKDDEKARAKEQFLQRNCPSKQNTPRSQENEREPQESDKEDQNLSNSDKNAVDTEESNNMTELEAKEEKQDETDATKD